MPGRSMLVTGVVFCLAIIMNTLTVSPAHSDTPIAEARRPQVTVEGWVTVPSGTFRSATFDEGFAIQDSTAGIYVSVPQNLGLHLDQRVRVKGRTQDDGFGLLILKPDTLTDVKVLPGAQQVLPQPVSTCDIGEGTEGSLVRVTGAITQDIRNDLPFGFGVFINSDLTDCEIQVFIHASSGIDPRHIDFIQLGRQIEVTGFSGQFLQFYEVSPRVQNDIKLVE